ncbi:MAG TPA: PadR family transcriptional regulator [Acidimicrobiales bacterium]
MPIHHAVLALLAEGPSHGYELKARFEEAVGPQWGPLNIGHLYQILARLDRDRMVRSHRAPQPARPDRVVYEITAQGRAELEAWLARPAERPGGYRDDLFLKILAADRSPDPGAVPALLSRQRAHLLGELRDLADLRRARGAHPTVRLLITAAELHVGAQLRFLDAVEDELVAGRPPTRAAASADASPEAAPEAAPGSGAATG